MSRFLVPALEAANARFPPLTAGEAWPHDAEALSVAESPFQRLTTLSRTELTATREVPAAERRLRTEHFVAAFQWETMLPLLPLRLAVPPGVRTWRPRHCRSYYHWQPPGDLQSTDDWVGLMILTWSCVCSTSALGGASWPSAAPVISVRLLSTPSVWAWLSSWPAGVTGVGPAC